MAAYYSVIYLGSPTTGEHTVCFHSLAIELMLQGQSFYLSLGTCDKKNFKINIYKGNFWIAKIFHFAHLIDENYNPFNFYSE